MTRQTAPEATPAPQSAGARLGGEVAQMYDLLDCGLQAWSAYWAAWLSARSLADILQANAALTAESFTLAGLAAARRQAIHGRLTPTLNEA